MAIMRVEYVIASVFRNVVIANKNDYLTLTILFRIIYLFFFALCKVKVRII